MDDEFAVFGQIPYWYFALIILVLAVLCIVGFVLYPATGLLAWRERRIALTELPGGGVWAHKPDCPEVQRARALGFPICTIIGCDPKELTRHTCLGGKAEETGQHRAADAGEQ